MDMADRNAWSETRQTKKLWSLDRTLSWLLTSSITSTCKVQLKIEKLKLHLIWNVQVLRCPQTGQQKKSLRYQQYLHEKQKMTTTTIILNDSQTIQAICLDTPQPVVFPNLLWAHYFCNAITSASKRRFFLESIRLLQGGPSPSSSFPCLLTWKKSFDLLQQGFWGRDLAKKRRNKAPLEGEPSCLGSRTVERQGTVMGFQGQHVHLLLTINQPWGAYLKTTTDRNKLNKSLCHIGSKTIHEMFSKKWHWPPASRSR